MQMEQIVIIIVVIAAVTLAVISSVIAKHTVDAYMVKRRSVSGSDVLCDLCFGRLGRESQIVCTCGKVFHRSCSDAVESCPYCGHTHKHDKAQL